MHVRQYFLGYPKPQIKALVDGRLPESPTGIEPRLGSDGGGEDIAHP